MELWEILVPTVRDDGKSYRLRFHRVWDQKVRAIVGGLTILKTAKGTWEAPDGTILTERMIPVRIACTEAQIHIIIDFTMAYYKQLAVMAYRVSDYCVIKHRRGSHELDSRQARRTAQEGQGQSQDPPQDLRGSGGGVPEGTTQGV